MNGGTYLILNSKGTRINMKLFVKLVEVNILKSLREFVILISNELSLKSWSLWRSKKSKEK